MDAVGTTVNGGPCTVLLSDMVTTTGPEVAVGGTTASTSLSLTALNDDAVTPLNDAEVAPVRPLPVMATVVPVGPDVGDSEVAAASADAGGIAKDITTAVAPT